MRNVKRREEQSLRGIVADDLEYAMPLSVQIFAVTRRRFTAYWRMPQYVYGKFLLHVFTGELNVHVLATGKF